MGVKSAAKRQLIKFMISRYVLRQRNKIRENPSARERMNLRTAEMLLEAYSSRGKAVLTGFLLPSELVHVYGLALSYTENLAAVIAGSGFGIRSLEVAEQHGHSREGCSYHRATQGAGLDGNLPRYRMMVATSHLCDGQNKALETLAEESGAAYCLLDVPQENSPAAIEYVAGQLQIIEENFAEIAGKRASPEDWARVFRYSNETRELMLQVNKIRRERPPPLYGKKAFNLVFQSYMMLGTRFLRDCYRELEKELQGKIARPEDDEERFRIIWLLSYPYFKGEFTPYLEDDLGVRAVAEELGYIYWSPLDVDRPLHSLAAKILENPQLGPVDNRVELAVQLAKDYSADGILHYSHWGCRQGCGGVRPLADAFGKLGIPFLDLDGDCIDDRNYSEGQTRTRLEGFVELMSRVDTVEAPRIKAKNLFMGVDIGSLSAKAVVIDGAGRILAQEIILTGASSKRAAQKLQETIIDGSGLAGRIAGCIATGYGRNAVGYADEKVTEITCHARGMAHQIGGVRTIIDIGGQDTKAISVDGEGNVKQFLMNDKCAAGTGRFLEVMARTLEISLEEFGPQALDAKKGVTISSMCTVFAESEVVSLIASGVPIEEIIRGLCESIAARTAAMVDRVGKEKKIAMSGGVAKNVGVVRALARGLGARIVLPEEPQIIGALGAAIIAGERYGERQSA